jgi:hypothetical protein
LGSYADTTGLTECIPVAAGSYAPSTGTVVPLACPAGTFTGDAGLSQCTLCGSGTFASLAGSSLCSDCTVGTYILASTSSPQPITNCSLCPLGQYQNGMSHSFIAILSSLHSSSLCLTNVQ